MFEPDTGPIVAVDPIVVRVIGNMLLELDVVVPFDGAVLASEGLVEAGFPAEGIIVLLSDEVTGVAQSCRWQ